MHWIRRKGFGCSYLNQVFALWFCYEWLKLGRCEGVNQASLGDNEQQYLGAGQDRELVGLRRRR
jgi:hypothetical protein